MDAPPNAGAANADARLPASGDDSYVTGSAVMSIGPVSDAAVQLPNRSARWTWGQNGIPAATVAPVAMRPTATSTLSRPSAAQ
jgi:hypothetical protein